eukprot:m.477993 g.477993  ORF g.477993 m.477993 type:complete len:340 (-) comp21007_c0_seq1:292-1311(-)
MAAKFFNKRAQALTEAVSKTVDKTEYDPDFQELEKATDHTRICVEKLVKGIPPFLHPNPAARAKLSVGGAYAKMTKTAADRRYPHATSELAVVMTKAGEDLGELSEPSLFGEALLTTGEALNQVTEANHAFDSDVLQNFMEPLKVLMDKDLKEIAKHRKKLEGRRLDFDYKRRKAMAGKTSISEADIKIAEQKLEESKGLSESSMVNLLENDVEQVGQLYSFVEAMLNFHRTSTEILERCSEQLQEQMSGASDRPKREVRQVQPQFEDDDEDYLPKPTSDVPCCRAMYDFEAENEGELTFNEGDIITLTARLDENWLEGEINGASGIFPTAYVDIIKDL